MEPTNSTGPIEGVLSAVLRNVTSGAPTVITRNNSSLQDPGYYWIETYGNWSTEAAPAQDSEDTEVWLTVRLLIIACVIVALVFLAWGSYSIHRKCFNDKEKQKYQKAMLL